jgi:hypothetical protein
VNEEQATQRFLFEVGALLRRHVVRRLREGALMYGVELALDEDRGLLDSQFVGIVTGPRARVEAFRTARASYFAGLGAEALE